MDIKKLVLAMPLYLLQNILFGSLRALAGCQYVATKIWSIFVIVSIALISLMPLTAYSADKIKIDIIKIPYGGHRNIPEISMAPDYVHASGLERLIGEWGGELIRPIQNIRLTTEQDKQHGRWMRMAVANSSYAAAVRGGQEKILTIGLEANCNNIVGMLAGLKYGADGQQKRVGLVFIDAHGDFNTPETTLSGRLGGMPVAVAAGHALHNLRIKAGLIDPIPMEDIVWGGVRDLDPLEAERFEEYEVQQFSGNDILTLSDELHNQMKKLSEHVDVIYVHVDIDVLDPAEVEGHDAKFPGGPSSIELAAALTEIFKYENVVALGVGGTPAASMDPKGHSRQAALNLIEGAIKGVKMRSQSN